MKLDNAKKAGSIRLIYMLIPLIVVVIIALVYLFYDVKDLRYMVFAFVGLLLFFLIMAILNYNYIIFYAGPDKVRVRYKGLSPFSASRNSVQINSNEFTQYEIKTSIFNIKKVLILHQQTPSGHAKYPSIGLSALNNSEINSIKKALDLVLMMNKN